MTTQPTTTEPQHMQALKRANEIRLKRSRLKRELATKRAHLAQVLRDPPDFMASCDVLSLLLAAPRLGSYKARSVLVRAGVRETTTLERLTERQRSVLLSEIEHGYPGTWAAWGRA